MMNRPKFSVGDCIVTDDKLKSALIVDVRYGGHQYDRDWYYVISPNDDNGSRPYELSQYDILYQKFDILCSNDIDNTDNETMGNIKNENTNIHRR